MIIKVANPSGTRRAGKKNGVGAQRGKTMATKKKRSAARKKNPATKKRKRARRVGSPIARAPKIQRRRVAKATNPTRKAARRVIRRRRNPGKAPGKSLDGMTIAKALGAGVAGGAAVTLANFAFNKQSGGAGKAVTLGIAAAGVLAGIFFAKKEPIAGMALAVGSAGAAAVPMVAQKVFEFTQPKPAIAALVDMGALERANMGAVVDGQIGALPSNLYPKELPFSNLASVDDFTSNYAQGVQQMAAIGADPYAEHDPI